MKHCKDCDFYKPLAVQVSPQHAQMMPHCTHEEASDPVTGEPLPCQVARTNPNFCGITGKYFKLKEVKSEEVVKLIQT